MHGSRLVRQRPRMVASHLNPERLVPAWDDPDELDVVLRLQQHVEAQPGHLLIIDQHDPDRHGSPFLIGRTARTRKPPSALGPVSRVPPWEATLSRMPTRP